MSQKNREESVAYDRAVEEGMKMYSRAVDRHREVKSEALHLSRTSFIILGIVLTGIAAFNETIISLPLEPQILLVIGVVSLLLVPFLVLFSVTSSGTTLTPERTILDEFQSNKYNREEFDKRMVEELNHALDTFRKATEIRNRYLLFGYTSLYSSLLFITTSVGTVLLSQSLTMVVVSIVFLLGIILFFWRVA